MSSNETPLLIVDDDTGLLRQLRWAFSDHKVYAASTRQEAIALVRKAPVSVAIDDLQRIVSRAERMFELEAENRRLLEAATASPIDGIIASSEEMLKVLRTIEKIAPTNVAVLLRGESGTGKELLAQAIHKLSARAREPFVPINCAAIPV